MGSIDGEIPAVWFLISSIGFVILSVIQFRNTGKSFNTIFLSVMAIIFIDQLPNIINQIKTYHRYSQIISDFRKTTI